MADEPLTAEELDALAPQLVTTIYAKQFGRTLVARLIAQARRCLNAEADLAHMYTMEACKKCGATIIAGCWGCRLKAAASREAALAGALERLIDEIKAYMADAPIDDVGLLEGVCDVAAAALAAYRAHEEQADGQSR